MYKTRRIRTNGAKLEQGLGKALPNKTAVAQQRKPHRGFHCFATVALPQTLLQLRTVGANAACRFT